MMWIWQLPQHLLGLLIIFITNAKYDASNNVYVCTRLTRLGWGISLGQYRIFSRTNYSLETIHHEEGHSKQSRYLGWFYLLVVGLPSIVRNIYGRLFKKGKMPYIDYYAWYHLGYPEKWADELGNCDVWSNSTVNGQMWEGR